MKTKDIFGAVYRGCSGYMTKCDRDREIQIEDKVHEKKAQNKKIQKEVERENPKR
jgi:hypothetical protein